MEIIVGVIVVVIVLTALGDIIGAPKASSLSTEDLLARMQSEGRWIQKYNALPFDNRQGAGIKKQYEDKKLYVLQLHLELMKRGANQDQETVIPAVQRTIELMRNGMSEEVARAQASAEYVEKRDGKA